MCEPFIPNMKVSNKSNAKLHHNQFVKPSENDRKGLIRSKCYYAPKNFVFQNSNKQFKHDKSEFRDHNMRLSNEKMKLKLVNNEVNSYNRYNSFKLRDKTHAMTSNRFQYPQINKTQFPLRNVYNPHFTINRKSFRQNYNQENINCSKNFKFSKFNDGKNHGAHENREVSDDLSISVKSSEIPKRGSNSQRYFNNNFGIETRTITLKK